jgi:hypothetical protein
MGMGIDESGDDPPSGDVDFPRFSWELEPGALPNRFDSAAADDHYCIRKCRATGSVDERCADQRYTIVRGALAPDE